MPAGLDEEVLARVLHSLHAGGSTAIELCLKAADDRAQARQIINRYLRLAASLK